MTPPPRDLILALTEDSAWLHRLARRLVADPHRAEDAAQRALLVALQRPLPATAPRRGWLAGILRNVVREDGRQVARRTAREASQAPRAEGPTPDEALARLDLQQVLVEALRELEEPYRTTLVLRFLEGASPRHVAERTGVPAKTVYTRIERGLERLRLRLDRRTGGDRSTWLPGLAALPAPSGMGWITGVTSMGLGIKSVAVASTAVVLAVVGAGWYASGERPAAPGLVTPAAESAPERSASAVLELPDSTAIRAGIAPEHDAVDTAEVVPDLRRTRRVAGRVQDAEGRPLVGVRVSVRAELATVSSDAVDPVDGIAQVDAEGANASQGVSDGAGVFDLQAGEEAGRVVATRAGHVLLAQPALPSGIQEIDDFVLTLAPARTLRVRVVDEGGAAVSGAAVRLALPRSVENQVFRGRHILHPTLWAQTTNAYGEVVFEAAARLVGLFAQADKASFVGDGRDVPVEAGEVELTLTGSATERMLAGQVVFADGSPATDALVSAGHQAVHTDQSGHFLLPLEEGVDAPTVRALAPGFRPVQASVDLTELPARPLTLVLDSPPLEIRGVVVDAEGRAVPGACVSFLGTTEFGYVTQDIQGLRVNVTRDAESLMAGAEPYRGAVSTDSEGRFRLGGLIDRDYQLLAIDPLTTAFVAGVQVHAGEFGARLQLNTVGQLQSVAGRVVTRSGNPVADVEVDADRALGGQRPDTWKTRVVRTDADGVFRLPALYAAGVHLRIRGGPLTSEVQVPLEGRSNLEDLKIEVGVRCYVRLEFETGDLADNFELRSREGEVLEVGFRQGNVSLSAGRMSLVFGGSRTLWTSDLATELVLLKEGEVVRSLPLELDPDSESVIRIDG